MQTKVNFKQQMVLLNLILDNFSRVILGWKASLEAGSLNPAANLLEVCKQYDLKQILDKSVIQYNEGMPSVFYGLTRNEVLNGKIPDKHLYSDKIKEAKLLRPEINRSQTCGVC
jgi:hypothetical protein